MKKKRKQEANVFAHNEEMMGLNIEKNEEIQEDQM